MGWASPIGGHHLKSTEAKQKIPEPFRVYQHMGYYDYNATPIAPSGTKVLVHETPAQRKFFGAHGIKGWYIGPALKYCRCFQCYIPPTASIRNALAVEWFPHKIPLPKTTTEEYLKQVASDLLTILKTTNGQAFPNLEYGNKVMKTFQQRATIL